MIIKHLKETQNELGLFYTYLYKQYNIYIWLEFKCIIFKFSVYTIQGEVTTSVQFSRNKMNKNKYKYFISI